MCVAKKVDIEGQGHAAGKGFCSSWGQNRWTLHVPYRVEKPVTAARDNYIGDFNHAIGYRLNSIRMPLINLDDCYLINCTAEHDVYLNFKITAKFNSTNATICTDLITLILEN